MKLAELLEGLVDSSALIHLSNNIDGIALDSRKVKENFVFIAVNGAEKHGLGYVQQAIQNGAKVVIYDVKGSEDFALEQLNISLVGIEDLALKLGLIADHFYHSPSRHLDVIGVTGTNGKTTCSQFLLQLLPDCGVIGTLGWGDSHCINETANTTPDALLVQDILAGFVHQKLQTVVMEVSSHGLQQGRVKQVCFKGAVFTNLSRDHLDYHGSMQAYLKAKLILFKQPGLQFVVVNIDDENSTDFFATTEKKVKRWAFSAKAKKSKMAENVTAEDIKLSLNGIEFVACYREERVLMQTAIIGDFNLENVLAVITVLLAQGFVLESIARKIIDLVPVSGRMEVLGGGDKPFVIVDYAHTPDALEKVLLGLKKYCQQSLSLVFGCGGDRDKGKRIEMGVIAEKLADEVIITADNPRFESSEKINSDIVAGFVGKKFKIIENRKQAILAAIKKAKKNDCIVIAGKGHEDYQDVKGVKYAFSDQLVVRQALQEWKIPRC